MFRLSILRTCASLPVSNLSFEEENALLLEAVNAAAEISVNGIIFIDFWKARIQEAIELGDPWAVK